MIGVAWDDDSVIVDHEYLVSHPERYREAKLRLYQELVAQGLPVPHDLRVEFEDEVSQSTA